jgi:hypothetical protein
MTHATMQRSFKPGRSPLFGVAAVFATAATIAVAVLLPLHATPAKTPVAAVAATQPAAALGPVGIVTLPTVEVVGTRQIKSAANRWNVPVVYRQKG